MFVKLLSGPRAGEAVEMKYADARALLNDGRAVLAYPPDPAPAVPVQSVKEIKDENQNIGNDSDSISRRKGRNKRRS
jgi:hypothetical protein